MPIKDLTGKRFDRLLVLGLSHVRDRKSYWKVQCDCGTVKVVRGDCLTAWHRLRGANPLPVEVAFTRPVKCND
jgi:hypothetical protein